MKIIKFSQIIILYFCFAFVFPTQAFNGIKIGSLARVEGVRDNVLAGYGIVIGLSGTGDSRRSLATLQSVANALQKFGVSVSPNDLSSRNVAAVMVTATIPAFSEKGNRIDVNVSSIGDSRSLAGGTLLLMPLKTVNGRVVAIAQGSVSVGGYSFDSNGNKVQKNHPTAGVVSKGAVIEYATDDQVIAEDGSFTLLLKEPNFHTASQIVDAINAKDSSLHAETLHAGRIKVDLGLVPKYLAFRKIGEIQELSIIPETAARIVINERTGTIVAGGNVKIDNVTITHGDLKIRIQTDYLVSQPNSVLSFDRWGFPGEGGDSNSNARTVVVPDTDIKVEETGNGGVTLDQGATVSDLISALNDMKLSTRDIITILQSINRAGALHGELVVQ